MNSVSARFVKFRRVEDAMTENRSVRDKIRERLFVLPKANAFINDLRKWFNFHLPAAIFVILGLILKNSSFWGGLSLIDDIAHIPPKTPN